MIESQAVSLCKDRNRFINEAVSSRNALSAAHSAYSICLKNTGAALCDFINGEFSHLSSIENNRFPTQHGATIMEDDKPELEDRNNEKFAKKRSNASDRGSSSEGESYHSCDQADPTPLVPHHHPVFPMPFHMLAVGKLGPKKGSVKMGRRFTKPVSLMQIFADLDCHFLKASESSRELSQMLGDTGSHYCSNSVDHFKRVMRVITWNFPFEGMPNVDDDKDGFDTEENDNDTHITVLDKMLAWEKILYNEVKLWEKLPTITTVILFCCMELCINDKQFYRLILCEKQYIRALHSWIKLTRIPIESTFPNIQNPPIYALLTAWIDDLDKLPDEVRAKCEETRKELEQKIQQFQEWCKKRGVAEEMYPDNPLKIAKEQRESVVVSLRRQLEKDEEECRKICRLVREFG